MKKGAGRREEARAADFQAGPGHTYRRRGIGFPEGVLAMEWSFECPNGGVTVHQEGDRALCQAIGCPEGEGLYKAWLVGKEGRALLGTLIPEGGALRLRRNVPISVLKEKGAWPPAGAEIVMAYPFAPEAPPSAQWRWQDCPCRLFADPFLSHALREINRALIKRDMDGFFLAVPYASNCPFPIPALFCLGRLERMGGRWYAVFRFSRQGVPELLHIFPADGENGTVT